MLQIPVSFAYIPGDVTEVSCATDQLKRSASDVTERSEESILAWRLAEMTS